MEVAGEEPKVRLHIEFSRDRAQASSTAVFLDVGDAVKHQHGWQRQLRIAGAKQVRRGRR